MLSWKTAACLAAGNTVVIKPAQVGVGMARGPRAWSAWAGAGHRPLRPPHAPPPLTGKEERALQVTAACEARLSGQTWCVWVSGLGQAGLTVCSHSVSIHIFSTSAPLWTPGPRLWALSLGPLLLKLELQTPNIWGKFLCVHRLGFSEKPRDRVPLGEAT